MSQLQSAEYKSRKLRDWLAMADNGKIALPSFQRDYIWDNKRIAAYLKALLTNRPTGIFLVLQVGDGLKFSSRTIKGVRAQPKDAVELLLDGQQRLTSLWSALNGKGRHRFFIQVKDLENLDMEVVRVKYFPSSRVAESDPVSNRLNNLVPVDLLWEQRNASDKNGKPSSLYKPGKIWDWCKKACKDKDTDENVIDPRQMENAIYKGLNQILLIERELWYCLLPQETETDEAIQIFVETNKSSFTIGKIDIVVAVAQKKYEQDLRRLIEEQYDSHHNLKHYFSRDPDKLVPELGECLFKIACLKIQKVKEKEIHGGLPPSQGKYEVALHNLFMNGKRIGLVRFSELGKDLKEALDFVAQQGAVSKQLLPSWPPVYVITALQRDLRDIRKPAYKATARLLLVAYLWRSFFTDRYESQANARLHKDFVSLRICINKIASNGNCKGELPPIFEPDEHPLPSPSDLTKPQPWITRGRRGLAISSIILQNKPVDWVLGHPLDTGTIRTMQDERKLDHHHIFPVSYIKECATKEEINHGLNGTLLEKTGNISLGNDAPGKYLEKILEQSGSLKEADLRKRVESHLVPYETLRATDGAPGSQYMLFIEQRAELIADQISKLTAFEQS